jgi:DNA-binding LacI/PurR family transcriptional regulator
MGERKQQVPRQKPLTSVDVARKAGVSRTAVSYVLNGTCNAHVSEETRAKVLQAAQELGYHPNASAQVLRKGKSNEVCILSNIALSANDAEIFVSMQQHAWHHGYIPVVYFLGALTAEQHRELLVKVLARRPLALLLTPDCIDAEDIALARQMGIEYIVLVAAEPIEEHFSTALPSVSIPTMEIGYLAAQHLLVRGHRALGIVRPYESRHELAFLQRLRGMHAAIADAGLLASEVRLDILPMHLSLADAHALVDTSLTSAEWPTGIYTFNDEYALPLLGALNDRGMCVPEDIAIIGTDNIAFSAFVRPALTTISFDNVALGQRVIEVLVALQKGGPLPEELTRPLIPELILRAST